MEREEPLKEESMNKAQDNKRISMLKELIFKEGPKLKFRLKMTFYLDDDTIEDAIQKGFEKLWTLRRHFLEKDEMTDSIRFIVVVAKNYLLDHIKMSKKKNDLDEKEMAHGILTLEDDGLVKQGENPMKISHIKKIEKALLGLTSRQREILQYKIYDGLSYSDIALRMNIKKGTAKSAYHQIIEKLKKLVKQ
jgi:RNA polymerase sigma factor (sigma-70 family)